MKKNNLLVCIVIALLLYIWWISPLAIKAQEAIKKSENSIFSEKINFGHIGSTIWEVQKNQLNLDGVLNLSIEFVRDSEKDITQHEFDIKATVDVSVIIDQNQSNRLLFTKFHPTNQIISNKKIWSGWGSKYMELHLNDVVRYSDEVLRVELNILQPDKLLGQMTARLKLNEDFDPALIGPGRIILLTWYISIFGSILLLIIYARQRKEAP